MHELTHESVEGSEIEACGVAAKAVGRSSYSDARRKSTCLNCIDSFAGFAVR